ncbi:hypothetical protein N7U66_00775 [Lacinutrix neustonica]|uniref:Uncharacterized protein n=1 Tax=Lacinutrix neustonica TaxID=2980107 RepID=A0A9E8MVH0_9FLAO|nr:hypothetical protein [Lacinutrix neustonica]WAC02323.1 hypothetical protein N7U66_00775 [Lacinutrix neustonica]
MKKTGIWLDKDNAKIVTLENEKVTVTTVASNMDHFHVKGGSGSKGKGGPQDVVQDSTYLDKEKQQLKDYFKNIVSKIKDTEALALFGPAQTNEKFSKELHDNYADLGSKIVGLKKVDSMTDNQVKALVKDFFQSM